MSYIEPSNLCRTNSFWDSLNSYSPKGPASCCASPRNYLSLAPAGPVPASNSASLNCSPTTVKYKLEHGQIALYHGKRHRYDAQVAQRRYQIRHLNCGRKQAFLAKTRFIKYVETHFFKQGWSLDACAGRALASGAFTRNETVCTKTLYHYVERGLLQIKATDLPECLSRKTKAKRVRQHKRRLAVSVNGLLLLTSAASLATGSAT